ncbi:MAG: hypothetical protein AAFZ52_10785 [Bacteroidota bacterium]
MLKLLYLSLLLGLASSLPAQQFSAIYQFSDAKIRQLTSSGWEGFLAEHRRQNAAGYRLTDLETYRQGGNERQYVGIYTESPLLDSVGKASSWSEFIKLKRKMAKAEYTMVDVAAVVLNETDADYYGVWVKDETPTIHKVWLLNSREVILKRTRLMAKDRFKIKRVHVLDIPNGEPAFVVLYHFTPINRFNFLFFANSLEEFNKERELRKQSKVELIDFQRFREGNKTEYVAIFQDGEYDSDFVTDQPINAVHAKGKELDTSRGLKLVNLSVD